MAHIINIEETGGNSKAVNSESELGDQDLKKKNDSEDAPRKRRNVSDISFELGPMKLPEDIKQKANTIYLSMPTNNIHRRNNRKFKILSAIYEAYNQSKIPCDLIAIAAQIGIPKPRVGRAISKFSRDLKSSRTGPIVNWNALDYIRIQLLEFGINMEHAETIEQLGHRVLEISRELREEKPQKVAKALIIHWALINGFKIPRESIAQMCGVSIATIDNIRNKIIEADNALPATNASTPTTLKDKQIADIQSNNYEIIIQRK